MPPDQQAPPQGLSTPEVEQQIQQGLNSEPMLRNSNVGVHVDENSVILTGTVSSEEQHDLALRIAQSYAGDRRSSIKISSRSKPKKMLHISEVTLEDQRNQEHGEEVSATRPPAERSHPPAGIFLLG